MKRLLTLGILAYCSACYSSEPQAIAQLSNPDGTILVLVANADSCSSHFAMIKELSKDKMIAGCVISVAKDHKTFRVRYQDNTETDYNVDLFSLMPNDPISARNNKVL